jgi:hypothetical protein
MSGEHELPTASAVRSSQATPARRRGQLFTDVRPAGLHSSKLVRCSDNRSHLSYEGGIHIGQGHRHLIANLLLSALLLGLYEGVWLLAASNLA